MVNPFKGARGQRSDDAKQRRRPFSIDFCFSLSQGIGYDFYID
jgi:hypothetical protein